jgi:hypothetical protein
MSNRALQRTATSALGTTPTVKVVQRIPSEDPVFNQFQDQLLMILNAFIREVKGAGNVNQTTVTNVEVAALQQYTTASRPAAGATYAGALIRVKDTSLPEQVQCCMETSIGTFEWVVVALASR